MLSREQVEKVSWNLGAYIGCPEPMLRALLDDYAALLEGEREVWEEARVAQAVWQNNRGAFYEQYGASTFDDYCRTQAKEGG
jgi:hypothetical protein